MSPAKKTTTDVVNTATGELVTINNNDVTDYLSQHGYSSALLHQLETPPAVYLNETEGAMLAGRFLSVAMTEVSEYGAAPVITLRAEAGYQVASTTGPVDLIPGGEYTMHLFSEVLHDSFVKAAPEYGELFVIRYNGMRASNSRKDKDGNAVEYHLWGLIMPDRPELVSELKWSDIAPKRKK